MKRRLSRCCTFCMHTANTWFQTIFLNANNAVSKRVQGKKYVNWMIYQIYFAVTVPTVFKRTTMKQKALMKNDTWALQQFICCTHNLMEMALALATIMACQISSTALSKQGRWSDLAPFATFSTCTLLIRQSAALSSHETMQSNLADRENAAQSVEYMQSSCQIKTSSLSTCRWKALNEKLSAHSHALPANNLSVKHFDGSGAGQRQAQFLREFCHRYIDHSTAVPLSLWVQSWTWQ